MVSTDFSLTPWGNLDSSINQMIEKEKKKENLEKMLVAKERNKLFWLRTAWSSKPDSITLMM